MKEIDLSHKICSDQIGKFPVTSSKGNKYIMIMHDNDSNVIIARSLRTKSVLEQLENMQQVHQFLSSRDMYPKMHIIDNECPQSVKDCIKNYQNRYLFLVLLHKHRVKAAEKSIDSCKCHFISGLATLNLDLLMHLWCRLRPL